MTAILSEIQVRWTSCDGLGMASTTANWCRHAGFQMTSTDPPSSERFRGILPLDWSVLNYGLWRTEDRNTKKCHRPEDMWHRRTVGNDRPVALPSVRGLRAK